MTAPSGAAGGPERPVAVRQRSWAEVRWRQFRHAPRPVVRAVLSSLIVAIALATSYVVYDVALSRGAVLPGGDLRVLALAGYAVLVLVVGSVVTYLVVPQPTGSGTIAPAERLERGARLLRRRADRLARHGGGDPDRPAAARLRLPRPPATVGGCGVDAPPTKCPRDEFWAIRTIPRYSALAIIASWCRISGRHRHPFEVPCVVHR